MQQNIHPPAMNKENKYSWLSLLLKMQFDIWSKLKIALKGHSKSIISVYEEIKPDLLLNYIQSARIFTVT